MIYSRLFGRAGNQLFQYAAGRALADHLGCDLVLDTRYVDANWDRTDCFGHFENARFLRNTALPPSKMDGALRYGFWRALGRNPRLVRETSLGFDPAFFDTPDNSYLHGYWQSEKYFAPISDAIRHDLAMTTPLDPANAAMAVRIAETPNSVSLHLRRGDYLAAGNYAACTEHYYRSALAALADRLGQPLTCFVFSNDPAWARDNLALGQDRVIVDLNDEKTGHFDMHLMSLCAHNIIANSSFSWWGAWLNANPDKLVAAPQHWFATPAQDNPDICPDNWLRI